MKGFKKNHEHRRQELWLFSYITRELNEIAKIYPGAKNRCENIVTQMITETIDWKPTSWRYFMETDTFLAASNCSDNAVTLTPETLKEAIRLLEAYKPIVGIACHPSLKKKIREEEKAAAGPFIEMLRAIPILIDPRLAPQKSEVHRDQSVWLKRCKEQKEWYTTKPTS